ncbi:MAG TPA: hypothetical protein VHD33_04255 [Legionellaceae bacterium]|nr:hypothetical protein [Legionellaceae bacterium]
MAKIQRATFTVYHSYVNGEPFSIGFNVGFIPHTVIVRQIEYGNCTLDTNLSAIQTDLVNFGDGIIGYVFPNSIAVPPDEVNTPIAMTVTGNAEFMVNPSKVTSGVMSFQILSPSDPGGTLERNSFADGNLLILLEFVRYPE